MNDDLRTEVTKLLHERALDIEPGGEHRLPSLPRPTLDRWSADDGPIDVIHRGSPGRRLLTVAAAVLVAAGGLAAAGPLLDAITIEENDAGEATTLDDADRDGAASDDEPADPSRLDTIVDLVEWLPEPVDTEFGSFVFTDPEAETGEQLVASYLADRLRFVETDFHRVDADRRRELFRWSAEAEGVTTGGLIVVRVHDHEPGVALAVTDGMTLELRRDSQSLRGRVATESGAEVEVGGLHPDGAAWAVDGFMLSTSGDDGGFVTQGPRPDPMVLHRSVHRSGPVVLIDVPIEARGFETTCGPNPPLAPQVSDIPGPLQNGPADRPGRPPIENQRVWHRTDGMRVMEIRWPADPVLMGRLPGEGPERAVTFVPHSVAAPSPTMSSDWQQSDTVVPLAGRSGPCSFAQITFVTEPPVAAALGDQTVEAFSSMGRVEVADQDPALDLGLDLDDAALDRVEDAVEDDDRLVIDSIEVSDRPSVPATGSCQESPEAPPRRSDTTMEPAASPEAALEALLVDGLQLGEPRLPARGYIEAAIADDRIVFFKGTADEPWVVIEVTRVDAGWAVTWIEATFC